MGGYGSGGHNRGPSGTLEAYCFIDATALKKIGFFLKDICAELSWQESEEIEGPVLIRQRGLCLCLEYSLKYGPHRRLKREQLIRPAWVERPFGGMQLLFECPDCMRRVKRLYLGLGSRFGCRTCRSLVYETARAGRRDRQFSKARKIRKKLGAGSDLTKRIPAKPRHLQKRKYLSLCDELTEVEGIIFSDISRRAKKMTGW